MIFSYSREIKNKNPWMRDIEAFRGLSNAQMLFVALVSDLSIQNPLRLVSENIRRRAAAEIAGYVNQKRNGLTKVGTDLLHHRLEKVEGAIGWWRKNLLDDENLTTSIDSLYSYRESCEEILLAAGKVPNEDSSKTQIEIWKACLMQAHRITTSNSLMKTIKDIEDLKGMIPHWDDLPDRMYKEAERRIDSKPPNQKKKEKPEEEKPWSADNIS